MVEKDEVVVETLEGESFALDPPDLVPALGVGKAGHHLHQYLECMFALRGNYNFHLLIVS